MKYELIPLGTKVLLKRVELEITEEEKEAPGFVFQAEGKSELEYFEVVETGKQCGYTFHKKDTVTVETYTPIGNFDGEELFITDERFVTCRILPLAENTSRK